MSQPGDDVGPVSAEMLTEAARIVSDRLAPSPLVRLDVPAADAPVHAKLESLQPTGSFKVRGAVCVVAHPGADCVVTASAGNFGLALAWAARDSGLSVEVVVPATAVPAKVDAIRALGVPVRVEEGGFDDAEQAARLLAARTGARYVSAYDDPWVLAGDATLLGETVGQVAGPILLAVPIGGGGLASGSALAAASTGGDSRIVGVEIDAAGGVSEAVRTGSVRRRTMGRSIADGLLANIASSAITPDVLREHGVRFVTVSETAVVRAVGDLALRHGLVVEGSGAVGYAALTAGLLASDVPTVLVLTGRNLSAAVLRSALT